MFQLKLVVGGVLLLGARFLLWVIGFFLRGSNWFIQRAEWLTPELPDEEEAEAI